MERDRPLPEGEGWERPLLCCRLPTLKRAERRLESLGGVMVPLDEATDTLRSKDLTFGTACGYQTST